MRSISSFTSRSVSRSARTARGTATNTHRVNTASASNVRVISSLQMNGSNPSGSELHVRAAENWNGPAVAGVVDALEADRPDAGLIREHAGVLEIHRHLDAEAIVDVEQHAGAEAPAHDPRVVVERNLTLTERRRREAQRDVLHALNPIDAATKGLPF